MNRLLVLTRVIDSLGPIKGEKSIQKIVYLLQSRADPLGYAFMWREYGPVCTELLGDLKQLEELGLIRISFDQNIPIYARNNDRKLTSKYWSLKYEHLELSTGFTDQIIKIGRILELTQKDPLSLEIIASVDFLSKKSEDPIRDLAYRSRGRITRNQIENNVALSDVLGLG